jgi:hypothetical protein
MSARFSHRVLPGEPVAVSIWLPDVGGETALFRTATEDGTVVIDRAAWSSASARSAHGGTAAHRWS